MADIVETIKLQEPITVTLKRPGGDERTETIEQVDVHRFKARDLRSIDPFGDNFEGSKILALVARITRQPIQVIDELGAADFLTLSEKVQSFMPNGQKTGATG